MLETSTAFAVGEGSVAEASHEFAAQIAAGAVENRGLLFDHRQGHCADWSDDTALLAGLGDAYGAAAEWMDLSRILDQLREPQTRELDGRRYFLNEPARATEDSWLPAGEWERHRVPGTTVDTSQPFVVALDMALRNDTASVRAVQLRPDGKVVTQAWPFVPTAGRALDVIAVENLIRRLHASGNCTEVAFDPAWFQRSAEVLGDDGITMLEFPQSPARTVPACALAFEQILAGNIVHDDDPVSTDQVSSAAPRESDGGWRLSKGKSRRKIDAAISLVIGVSRVFAAPPPSNVFAGSFYDPDDDWDG